MKNINWKTALTCLIFMMSFGTNNLVGQINNSSTRLTLSNFNNLGSDLFNYKSYQFENLDFGRTVVGMAHIDSNNHSLKINSNPFELSYRVDGHLLTLATALFVYGKFGMTQPYRDSTEIVSLNSDKYTGIDKLAIGNWNEAFDAASYGPLILSGIGSFAICFMGVDNNKYKNLIMWVEVFGATSGLTAIAKNAVGRARPFAYNSELAMEIRTDEQNSVSFFSGHTSLTAAFSFFSASVFSQYSLNKKVENVVWATAIIFPAVTGTLRVLSGWHFPTDVITGYAVGALIGWGVPKLHQLPNCKNSAFYPVILEEGGGLGYSLSF